MDDPTQAPTLRIGAWRVDARQGRMTRADETVRLEPRTLRLLLCLAERPGALLSADYLASAVWPGLIVTPDSVYQGIASLRRLLGDDPKAPSYLATEPRRGYRLIAQVAVEADEDGNAVASSTVAQARAESVLTGAAGGAVLLGAGAGAGRGQEGLSDPPTGASASAGLASPAARAANDPIAAPASAAPATAQAHSARRRSVLFALAALLALAAIGAAWRYVAQNAAPAPVSPRSVAVLPFLDLTDTMGEEPFADGMTEELIDRLSKSGLRVSAPTAAFYYKDKQLPVAQIAAQLGVAYVVDGSVRKGGDRMRIAARLMRADDGFVIWSETYDRPRDDLLKVQDEIAAAVAAALPARIDAASATETSAAAAH